MIFTSTMLGPALCAIGSAYYLPSILTYLLQPSQRRSAITSEVQRRRREASGAPDHSATSLP
jgi:hypothetical protein